LLLLLPLLVGAGVPHIFLVHWRQLEEVTHGNHLHTRKT
jgi:hypothetical protein